MREQLQNAYETLSDPTKRRAYDVGFFHCHYQQHQPDPTSFNTAAHLYRGDGLARRRAAAAEFARYKRYEATKQRNLVALRVESRVLEEQVQVAAAAMGKLLEELRAMAEREEAEQGAERAREKAGRDPRSWFWEFGGTAARREEEAGRRATERRHREEGRRVRVKELEVRRREAEVLRDKLEKNRERYRRAEGETIEEVERAEQARMEREKAERERMDREWREEKMERERLVKEERERCKAAEMERVRKTEEEKRAKEKFFDEFSERIETEEKKPGLWQGPFCREAEQEPNQEAGDKRQSFERLNCKHDSGWTKVEREDLCSRCGILSSLSTFRCQDCSKVACGSCQRMLEGETKWRSFSGHPDVFGSAGDGKFSVF